MLRGTWRCLVAVVAAGLATAAWAADAGPVTVELTARRISTAPSGEEVFLPGNAARPGDVVEYVAVYRNTGRTGIRNVEATLPVPAGMEYVPTGAVRPPAAASLDGRTYRPVPLTRVVTLPDGRKETRTVPYAEYRYLRWTIGELAGGGSTALRARARVTPVPGDARN
jgi:uncharacterized repeat protein (TIGR01451 family)